MVSEENRLEKISYDFIVRKFQNKLEKSNNPVDLKYFEQIVVPAFRHLLTDRDITDLSLRHRIHILKRSNDKSLHLFHSILKDARNVSSLEMSFDIIKMNNIRKYYSNFNFATMYYIIKDYDIDDICFLIRCTEIDNQFINFLYKEKII